MPESWKGRCVSMRAKTGFRESESWTYNKELREKVDLKVQQLEEAFKKSIRWLWRRDWPPSQLSRRMTVLRENLDHCFHYAGRAAVLEPRQAAGAIISSEGVRYGWQCDVQNFAIWRPAVTDVAEKDQEASYPTGKEPLNFLIQTWCRRKRKRSGWYHQFCKWSNTHTRTSPSEPFPAY